MPGIPSIGIFLILAVFIALSVHPVLHTHDEPCGGHETSCWFCTLLQIGFLYTGFAFASLFLLFTAQQKHPLPSNIRIGFSADAARPDSPRAPPY